MRRTMAGSTVGARRSWLVVLALVAACTVGLAAPAFADGTVFGTILAAEDSSPLDGVQVQLLDPIYGNLLASTTTAVDGTYSIPYVAGTYRLYAHQPSGSHGDTFSGNVGNWPSSSTFDILDGDTTQIDLDMQPFAKVHGVVTDMSATPLQGIRVEVLNVFGLATKTAYTDVNGEYLIEGIPDGTYKLGFTDLTFAYGRTYYSSSISRAEATPFVLVHGSDETADMTLDQTGVLAGRATVDGFLPVPNAIAVAFSTTGFELLGFTVADADGYFFFSTLTPGSYRIAVVDPASTITPDTGLRPIFLDSGDVLTDLPTAYSSSDVYDVYPGTTTDLNDARLVGYDCAPAVFVAGADLSGADFSGADLRGCDLTEIDLSGADLSGADLTAADLTYTDLTGADLTGATISWATAYHAIGLEKSMLVTTDHDWTGLDLGCSCNDLSGIDFAAGAYTVVDADFQSADLSGTNWTGVDVTGVRFASADLRNSTGLPWSSGVFAGTDLAGTLLDGIDLSGADFTDTDLAGSSLSGTDLTGAILTGTILTYSDLSYTTGLTAAQVVTTYPDWSDTYLKGSTLSLAGADLSTGSFAFTFADLTGISLAGADLRDVDFYGANLTGASLAGAQIGGADLSYVQTTPANLRSTNHDWTGALLVGVSLDRTNFSAGGYDLTDVDLSQSDLDHANFSGMDLINTNLTDAYLDGANFNNVDLSSDGTWIDGASLWDAKFNGADLSGFDFSNASLLGVDFRNADLAGTDFTDAALAGARLGGADASGATFLGATGDPVGGATVVYSSTVCPDGTTANDGINPPLTCVGLGFAA